jgi:hypothetical protein
MINGKVFPVHVMKACMVGSRGALPLILILGIRRRGVVTSCTVHFVAIDKYENLVP